MIWRIDHDWAESWIAAQPADSVDLVFGSPPYLNQRTYGGMNPERSEEDWVRWMVNIYQSCLRVCKGAVCFVVDSPTKDYRWTALPHLLAADLVRAGVTLRRDLFYRRGGIPGSGGPDWFANKVEYIICATRGGKLPWADNTACGHPPKCPPGGECTNRMRDGKRVFKVKRTSGYSQGDTRYGEVERVETLLANPGNVIDCGVSGGGHLGDADGHRSEAPFPEKLAAFVVKSLCPPGGVVCDPFTGSGTTAKVAVVNGRNFVGCEMRSDQCEIARNRVRKAEEKLQCQT